MLRTPWKCPPNARLLFCNGQVGARLDGTVPENPLEQIEVIFERIRTNSRRIQA